MSGGFIRARSRAGDDPSSSPAGSDTAPDKSQVAFLASGVPAPTTPALPIDSPSAPSRIGLAQALLGSNPLLLWDLVPLVVPGKETTAIETDYAWRWQKHYATPQPAFGLSPYMFVDDFGVEVVQQPIPSGGGSYNGFSTPGLYAGRGPGLDGAIVDPVNTPVWTLAVGFDTIPITVDGTPPPSHSTGTTPPFVRMSPSPIVGNSYTNGPWLLYVQYAWNWVGVAGSWDLVLSPALVLSYGGSGGPTVVRKINGVTGGVAYVEFDNTAKTILLVGGTSTGNPPSSGPGETIPTGTSGPGGWPGDLNGYRQEFGASNMGAYYWASWRQLNGTLYAAAIVPLSGEDTVSLVSERTLVPGTGPGVPKVAFRADSKSSKPLPSELSDYTHYWPLDDKSPGPMYDLLAGSYLTVQNATLATFQVDGVTNPLSPTHTKAIRLGPGTRSNSYLTWGGRGPKPSLGTGAVGHDLTIGCWIKWEGPTGITTQRDVFTSSQVSFGFGTVTALSVTIWPYAEPLGVQFKTWDSVAHTFATLRTPGFDWPADYVVVAEGSSLPLTRPVPVKEPVWAYLAVVLRTVSGHMTMEIWVDGVLISSMAGSDHGWGADIALLNVGAGIVPATLQHLSIWPFALSAASLEGIAS